MMKKHLFLRLCLIFLVGVSAFSCRTEEFHNEEEAHGSNQFRLTNQRISLSQAKHKAKLFPELEKAKKGIAALQKVNVNGRIINYGNGVSIDTDDVIYIENGPNYHTYTFHIRRDNAPADAPLENLLLAPLPDGTYKEILITYTLTEAEKAKLQAGLFVDTRGKTEVTRLENGTFNGSSQLARQVCTTSSYSYWEACSGNQHHDGSNYESCPIYQGLEQGTPPIFYTIVTTTCLEQNEMIITPIDPPNNGGGSSGGGSGEPASPPATTPPCTTPSVPTNPQPGFTDENGCPIGEPSLPNYPPTKGNPCEKVKNITDNTTGLKDKIKSLNTPANLALNYERGAIVADNAQGESVVTPIDGNPNETFINVYTPPTGEQTAFIHTHFEGSTMSPIFSFEDLGVFDAIHFQRFTNNKPLDKLTIMVISKEGIFALRVDNSVRFYNVGGEMMTNRNEMIRKYYGDLQEKVNVTYGDIIKQVAKVLPNFGVSLYKATDDQLNSWNKVVYDPATDTVNEMPCN
ncbi:MULTISPECIES: hypothetical protein [Chryseobacterium]|uniref:Uncharacterized protein n=1 Tax=Chryseobacterium taihuense TaxID=1141221 RepID=A0A4U8W9Q1_9FLAO|nr:MULTISPECIES: hypothetical protein [Chryseobacterium]QQV03651.1 hypothetical protein I6I61_04755 [Chryseobacterium sp. FDAARGOS 1104]VFB03011.1 Uncharacterised protein [Chryseobacterium taihuense]